MEKKPEPNQCNLDLYSSFKNWRDDDWEERPTNYFSFTLKSSCNLFFILTTWFAALIEFHHHLIRYVLQDINPTELKAKHNDHTFTLFLVVPVFLQTSPTKDV